MIMTLQVQTRRRGPIMAKNSAKARTTNAPSAKDEAPQVRSAKTRTTRTRMKIYAAFVRLARKPHERQLTVSAICRQAGVSQAAFYKNFDDGVEELLRAVASQMADKVRWETARWMAHSPDPDDRIERTLVTTVRLAEYLVWYPNLFLVEGLIPRDVIVTLSEPLRESITNGRKLTRTELRDTEAMSKYHATALVGIMRSGLGRDVSRTEFSERLTHVAVSQVVPALLFGTDSRYVEKLDHVQQVRGALQLHFTSMSSVDRLARLLVVSSSD